MFVRRHRYLVALDSDGCALDVMERKHARCFLPATIETWGMEPLEGTVREVWEHVNLYSDTRGLNRFAALLKAFDMLAGKEVVRSSGFRLPDTGALRELVRAGRTSIDPIRETAEREHTAFLKEVVAWSERVNRYVVERIEPRCFAGVEAFLKEASGCAHVVVVSSATTATLHSEWRACGIEACVDAICGQEGGSKAALLKNLAEIGFAREDRLMIGDAPGDAQAAHAAGYAFYPIIPRQETASWKVLSDRHWPAFLKGRYVMETEPRLREQFHRALPTTT